MNEMLSDFIFILSSMRIDRKLTNYSILYKNANVETELIIA